MKIVLKSGVLHEMLGKMTVISNDFVLVCTSITLTLQLPPLYNCMQHSSVSRAHIEVASYVQSFNILIHRGK